MPISVELIPGPPTSQVTRSVAEAALAKHPMVKGAHTQIEPVNGYWVAAIVREADFGGPADSDEESPAPKSEGPSGDAAPSPDEDGSSDSDSKSDGGSPDGSDGPPSHGGDDKGGKGGVEHQLLEIVQQIAESLGIPVNLGASPVPGLDGGPTGPAGGPAGPPTPGPAGPPPGAGGPPGMDKKVHERALKPGETPPGGTPVGAPAFASVRADHPWGHLAGKVASFKVADVIGDAPMADVVREVTELAKEIGYKAKVREGRNDRGERIAEAVITAH